MLTLHNAFLMGYWWIILVYVNIISTGFKDIGWRADFTFIQVPSYMFLNDIDIFKKAETFIEKNIPGKV